MTENFSDSEIQDIRELKENQNTKKSTLCWLTSETSWAENKNSGTDLLSYETKQLDENKQMALHDWKIKSTEKSKYANQQN